MDNSSEYFIAEERPLNESGNQVEMVYGAEEPELPIPPKGVSSRVGYPVDWNIEFQNLLALKSDTKDQVLEKNKKISALSKNFVRMAKRWGKIIIEEMCLPPEFQTIPPSEFGGSAGTPFFVPFSFFLVFFLSCSSTFFPFLLLFIMLSFSFWFLVLF